MPGAAICCAAERSSGGHGGNLEKIGSSDQAAAAAPAGAYKRDSHVAVSEVQFSSLYSGVVQRLAQAIRGAAPRPPPVALDTFGPRAIQIQRTRVDDVGARRSKVNVPGPFDLGALQFHCLVALRCEKLNVSGKPEVRLLLVTDTHVELYEERAELFGVPLMMDQDAISFTGRDGLDSLRLAESVPIDNLATLELEMSAEPRARLAEAEGTQLLLEFADDNGAMLFRHHMRRALWGRGQVGWTSTSLGGERT